MTKQKKITGKVPAVIIAVALSASAFISTATADSLFSDVPEDTWYTDAVNHLANNNILEGPGDGTFNPNGTLDRSQAAQVIFKALDLPIGEATDFSDLTQDWYKEAVNAVISAGIFDEDGTGDRKFSPNADLTRAQAAKVIVDAYGLEGEMDLSSFPDVKTIPDWALVEKNYLAIAVKNGVINGKEIGDKVTLSPNTDISRAEFATMIKRAIDVGDMDNEVTEAISKAESAISELPSVEDLTLEDLDVIEIARKLVNEALYIDKNAKIDKLNVLEQLEYKMEELKLESDEEFPLLLLNQSYVSSDNEMTVTMNDIEINDKGDFVEYTITYEEANNTSETVIDEGSFKIYYKDGDSEPQYGFFGKLFPGEKLTKSYTFKYLKDKEPLLVEYGSDLFFKEHPTLETLKW